jgi:hypothetical protein
MQPAKFIVSKFKTVIPAVAITAALAVLAPALKAGLAVQTAKLHLISLHCLKTEDIVGPDHAYLLVNGLKVWGPQALGNGDTADLRQVGAVPFTGSARLSLYDKDFADPDDWLGDVVISPSQAGRGERTAVFSQDGAHYVLTYTVTR